MKKRLLMSGLVLLVLAAITPSVHAIDKDPDTPASDIAIVIDGKPAELNSPIFILNSTTYVPLCDFATALGADSVTRGGDTDTAAMPDLIVAARDGDMYLTANGRYLFVPDGCQSVNGVVLAPVRVLSKAFGASVAWDGASRTVSVTKDSGPITPGNVFYDKTDLYWMSRIINAEARGEPLAGKIAVGGVVMNRLKSPDYPKTVHDVIFDNLYGVQFTPTEDGSIYNTPSEECIIAAKIALDGGNTAGDSLYFAATVHCWAGRNRPASMTIGNHFFYD